ncbi:MAG: BMP family ABC transporter substrate-binding protein [Chloroflexi bacterium]|nr:BMP family ABC transporter substrate-binding protein [Chloroflexota bacterium]
MSEGTKRRLRVWSVGLTAALLAGSTVPAFAQDAAPITKIAYISPEAGTDFGWNQQGLAGAEAAAASIGAELLKADAAGYDDPAPILNQLREDGAQFIIAQASGYTTTAAQFARDNGIPSIVWDQPDETTAGLVQAFETHSQEGGYLAGVLAALTSTTGTVGIVISADDVNWNKQAGGFAAGAKATNPDIQILKAQIGPAGYGDAAGGRSTTETVIAGGADVIFGMGDGSSFGMLQAVETATPPAGAEKVWFIDVIGDKTSIDEQGVLLSSVVWDFAPGYVQALADLAAGTFGSTGYTLDAANGGIKLLQTDKISAEAWAAVEAARAGIADGSITVPLTATPAEVDAVISGQ